MREVPTLDHRLLSNTPFAIGWVAVLFTVVICVAWPLRNAALVLWVYGSRAYFHDGVRVLGGKPVKFSTGAEVPVLLDMVTGFAAFFIPVLGLTGLLVWALRTYERRANNARRAG
jgi:hypothetical protein